MPRIAQRDADFTVDTWDPGEMPEATKTAVKASAEKALATFIEEVLDETSADALAVSVRENLNTLLDHLDVKLDDITPEHYGTDLAINICYRFDEAEGGSCEIIATGSMKQAIDDLVRGIIAEGDTLVVPQAVHQMRAISVYLKEAAERLEQHAPASLSQES